MIENRDFFGGSLTGIMEKLSYLEDLGVTCIYLSPVFEAFSNHRYDTADYHRIDPMLGTNEDFSLLCSEAEDYGIRILLDGVFNHTGLDSIYFNGFGRYPSTGAYQSINSPYYSWYTFRKWPDDYVCWWDIKTLPKANANDSGYADFIAGDKNSVIRRWLAAGASGWRLDVADEIPDLFIRRINRAARSEKDDAIIIGEVWEDASNKISYGARRDYLLGGALDGVMNYPFRDAARLS
jgi:glycosidase